MGFRECALSALGVGAAACVAYFAWFRDSGPLEAQLQYVSPSSDASSWRSLPAPPVPLLLRESPFAVDARRLFPGVWLCPDNEGFPAASAYLAKEPADALRSQFGEDWEFFRDFVLGKSRHAFASDPGVFVEIGALDGERYSNTYFLENALNWRGVLIDALPHNARRLLQRAHAGGDRRHSLALHMAVCLPPRTSVRFLSSDPDTSAVGGAVDEMDPGIRASFHGDASRNRLFTVPCGPIGPYLLAAGLRAIDFWSLDVEGSELTVLRTFAWGRIAVHYLLVEVNSREPEITAFLAERGMQVERWMGNAMSVLYVNRSFEEVPFAEVCVRV